MRDHIDVTIRIDDHPTPQGHIVEGWRPSASVVVTEKPARVEILADDPGVLRELGYALIDLADELETARRPYVGEDAERSPAIALMRRGLAEMRNDLARGDEDADRGEAS